MSKSMYVYVVGSAWSHERPDPNEQYDYVFIPMCHPTDEQITDYLKRKAAHAA